MNIEKYTTEIRKLIDTLELVDRYKRSHKSLQSGINWFFAISTGTFLWFITNFISMKVELIKFDKILSLIILILLFLAMINFGIIKIMTLLREFLMNTALDSIQNIPNKILLREKNYDYIKIKDKYDEKIEEYGELWRKGHNLLNISFKMIKPAVFTYSLAILLIGYKLVFFVLLKY